MGIKRLALAASCGRALALMAVAAATCAGFTSGSATPATSFRRGRRISGLDLHAFFDAWLYQPGKPTSW